MNAQLKELYRKAGDAVEPAGDVQQVLNRANRRRVATQVGTPLATAAAVAGAVGIVVQPWSDGSDAPVASDDATAAGVAGLPDPTMVAGNTYVADESNATGVPKNADVEITFHQGSFAATAGCNTFNGRYNMSDDVLVSSPTGTTAGFCPGAAKVDGWLESFLASRPQVTIDDNQLRLDNGESDVTLAVQEIADKPLTGTKWRLDSIVDSTSATVSSVPQGMSSTLSFDGTDKLDVNSGCRRETASVDVADDAMTLATGSDARTPSKCAAPSVDRTVREVLDGSVGYEIEGAQLRIQDDEGALVYTAN